jgi:hypothetical protein
MNKTITLLIIGVIFLALLLMLFNAFTQEERQSVPAAVTDNVRPHEHASSARVPAERAALAPSAALTGTPTVPPQAQSDAVEQTGVIAGVAVKTVPAQIDAGHTAPSSPPSPEPARLAPVQASVASASSAKHTSGDVKNITSIAVYATQEGATIRLGGDSPLVYTSMLLHNPDRFVLDLEGQWNMTIPGIPQNKLVKAIRVGRQADSTRMVVDLHRAPVSCRVIKPSPHKLDVRLR